MASSRGPQPLRTLTADEFIAIANAHGRGVAFRQFRHDESGQYVTFPVLNGSFRPPENTTDWLEQAREELLRTFLNLRPYYRR